MRPSALLPALLPALLLAALLVLVLATLPAPGAAAQQQRLPELGPEEDVPRRAPLPPPPPAAGDAASDGAPAAAFGETIDVALATHVVRVLAADGAPLLGLGAADFRASAGGAELPVVAAEWHDSGGAVDSWTTPRRGAELPAESGGGALAPGAGRLADLPGKLVVVFVQADFEAERIYGHLKQLPNVGALLDTLAPRDRVAVVSFDTHMELWQDFTTDREAARRAVWKAIHFGADPPAGGRPGERRRGPSLAARLDEREMADAAYAENALELLGDALAGFRDDEKVILFLGWGLGRYGFGGFRMRPDDYPPALAALRRANASVFVLDVMDAASHTLEIGLQQVAVETGGLYVRTAVNPMQAFRRMAQALSGYYLVTVDVTAAAAGAPVTLAVAGEGRRARVTAHRVNVSAPPGG